jgi:hypothetical protein
MQTFKVTLHIQDGLTLGHVLMTKGVTLIHIIEIDENVQKPKLIEHKTNGVHRSQFRHPSMKPALDFVRDYLQKQETASWRELRKFIVAQGFANGTINNAIQRLLKEKQIVKVSLGIYKLVR